MQIYRDGLEHHPVDRHVGRQIRLRRQACGVSQEQLAGAVGLTFQQIQKYERGANRVAASRLWDIARALRTEVASFYAGLSADEVPTGDGFTEKARDFLRTSEGAELASAFPRLEAPLRRRVLELVGSLADPEP